MDDFKREFLGTWAVDHVYEFYVEAWTVYHKTADQIDGEVGWSPRNQYERDLISKAAATGTKALNEFFSINMRTKPTPCNSEDWARFKTANKEALRRLGK